MSPAEKVALVESMSQTVRDLAMAGLKQRYPNAAARELFLRMAMLTLGADLALVAYPEIATLDVDGK